MAFPKQKQNCEKKHDFPDIYNHFQMNQGELNNEQI